MNLKALIAAAAVTGVAFGGVATAEAKPHEKKLKHCKQHGKKLTCQTPEDKTVQGVCPGSYEPVQLVQLPPGNEVADVNGNFIVCHSAELGVTDDKPVGSSS